MKFRCHNNYLYARISQGTSRTLFFQLSVTLKNISWQEKYPMDYYSNDSLGPWTVNNEAHKPPRRKRSAKKCQGSSPQCCSVEK